MVLLATIKSEGSAGKETLFYGEARFMAQASGFEKAAALLREHGFDLVLASTTGAAMVGVGPGCAIQLFDTTKPVAGLTDAGNLSWSVAPRTSISMGEPRQRWSFNGSVYRPPATDAEADLPAKVYNYDRKRK